MSTALLQNQIFAQLLTKIPRIYVIWWFSTVFTKSRPWTILSGWLHSKPSNPVS